MSYQIVSGSTTVTIVGDGTATYTGPAPSYIGSLPVLWPPKNPDQGAEISESPNVYDVRFGDGYTQRSPKGLNHIEGGLPLTWTLLTTEEKDALLSFCRERGGHKAFWYRLPGDRLMTWRAAPWRYSERVYGTWTFSTNLIRVFDQVT